MGSLIIELGHVHRCKKGSHFEKKTKQNRMANSVDPDETAHYEPSHLDLHCLYKYLFWSARLKGLCGQTKALIGLLILI